MSRWRARIQYVRRRLRPVGRWFRGPGPWLLGLALSVAWLLRLWLLSPEGAALGPAAASSMFGVVIALGSAAGMPTEPLALMAGSGFGAILGGVVVWFSWTLGSMLQYGAFRLRPGAAPEEAAWPEVRLPNWLPRVPISHPLTLLVVRWLPLGAPVANAIAAAYRVPVKTQLGVALVGALPTAFGWAAIGAGVSLGVAGF